MTNFIYVITIHNDGHDDINLATEWQADAVEIVEMIAPPRAEFEETHGAVEYYFQRALAQEWWLEHGMNDAIRAERNDGDDE